jgi:hypothetical protein
MDLRTYAKASAINLAFLLAGALIGPVVTHPHNLFQGVVHAQAPTKDGPNKPLAKVEPQAPPDNAEYVSPGITTGVAAFYQVLAHQAAFDQVMVQGIDLLKLQENTLNLLRTRGIPNAELQKVVDDSRVPKPLKIKPQP